MKKFLSNLSNKNKLMVCKGVEYASLIISLMLAFVASNVLPFLLTFYCGALVSAGVLLGIEKKWGKGIRKNYLKELSNEYYLNNKDSICVENELKNSGVLLRIRCIFSLYAFVILLVLFVMLDLAAPIANAAFVFSCGFSLFAKHVLDKIELSYGTIIRVVEMVKSDVKDVGIVDDDTIEATIQKRLNRHLDYTYVPFSDHLKVSGPEYKEFCDYWNGYLSNKDINQETRRGPVKARIKPEDNKRN